jgi:tetratricopeptide (TPR) repeat protein
MKKLFGRGGLPKGELIPMAVGMEAEKLHDQGDLLGALAVYERFLADHSDSAHGLNNAANLLLDLGEGQRAKELLDRALEIDPEYESALCNLAEAKHMLKDHLGARNTYEQVLAKNPRSVSARMGLGGMFLDLENGRMAHQYLAEAAQLRPRQPAAWLALGRAKIMLGDLDGAEKAFERVFAIDARFEAGQKWLLHVRELRQRAAKIREKGGVLRVGNAVVSDRNRVLVCHVCGVNYVEHGQVTGRERSLGGALCRQCGSFYCESCVARAIHSGGSSMRCACGAAETMLGEAGYLRFEGFEELVVFRERE